MMAAMYYVEFVVKIMFVIYAQSGAEFVSEAFVVIALYTC